MKAEHYIEDESLSVAWAKALRLACTSGKEVTPLIVSVPGSDDGTIRETPSIRAAIDKVLTTERKQSVETVSGTIFPQSLWNRSAPRAQLYERYHRILPKLRMCRLNKHGIYFERMLNGGPKGYANQLEHVIQNFTKRKGVRRSALQVATFDPSRDHTASALRGFPCLQHVTFAPRDGVLNVNAFYATQFLVQRGYGNYLGLCRLGSFVAHELKMPLGRFTCLVGVAQCETSAKKIKGVLAALDKVDAA
jgi:hypothetical protein